MVIKENKDSQFPFTLFTYALMFSEYKTKTYFKFVDNRLFAIDIIVMKEVIIFVKEVLVKQLQEFTKKANTLSAYLIRKYGPIYTKKEEQMWKSYKWSDQEENNITLYYGIAPSDLTKKHIIHFL